MNSHSLRTAAVNCPLTRRGLLQRAVTAAAAPLFIPGSALGQDGRPPPSRRLTMGILGLGSMGMRNLMGFLQEDDCQVAAVCDVDKERRLAAVAEVEKHYGRKGCLEFNDFRELVGRRDLDLLCISLPDHWHSITSIMGAAAGKHIYGEKPLALTICEGRAMVEAIRRHGCIWQTGSWQRSTSQFRFACELVRNGRIGKLRHVEVGMGLGPTIEPQPVMPVPEGFDYEMWQGPAPEAPYTEKRCHWNFRWILDYSGGQITDCGAHDIDIAHWGMDVEHTGPVEVEGLAEYPTEGLWDSPVTYTFGCRYANGLTMSVAGGGVHKTGIKFVGERGWVHVNRSVATAQPASLLRERFGPDEIRLYRSSSDRQGHRRNFLDCVKSRSTPASEIEVAHRSITVAHLANIAMKLGRKIRWNPQTEQIVNDPAAARLLSRPMRGAWGV